MRAFLADDWAKVLERLKGMLAALPGIATAGSTADLPEAFIATRLCPTLSGYPPLGWIAWRAAPWTITSLR
jgi:hypothetical protein